MNDIYKERRAKLLKAYEYLVYAWIALVVYAYIFISRECFPADADIYTVNEIGDGYSTFLTTTFLTGLYLVLTYFVKIPFPSFNQFIKLTFFGALVAAISMVIRCG